MLTNGSNLRGLRGLGMPAGYSIAGYCPGTNFPNWVMKPDGTTECMTDAQIAPLMTMAPPAAPPVPAATSGSSSAPITAPTPSLPILPSQPAPAAPLIAATSTGSASSFDLTSAIEQYKWWIAGGVGAIALLVMMRR